MSQTEVSSLLSRLLELSGNLDHKTLMTKEILTSYFGQEILDFEGLLPEDEKNKATSILEGFYSLAFDKGLRKNTILEIGRKEQTEKPVFLLSRSAWIDQLEKKAGEDFANLQGVLMLDVASLNDANKVTDDGHTAGDFLLQRVARLLNQALEDIDSDTKKSFDFIPCRYGGDEFAVAVIRKSGYQAGDINLNDVLEKLKAKISSEKAFYKRQGKDSPEEDNIQLKEEGTKAIKTPEADLDRLIFIRALQSGLVVDEKEIELIKTIFENDPNKIENYFRQYQIQEPDYDTEALFIMHDLVQKHPEFAPVLYLANLLDQKDEGMNGHKRLISLLRFVRKGLNDRLLSGEKVLGFEDFLEHLKRGEFSQIFGIEIKFVKELNDHFSMVVADYIIRKLYDHLRGDVSPDILNKLNFYRRGGSFFIGVKQGVSLDDKFINVLQQKVGSFLISDILTHQLLTPLQIPLGFFIWRKPKIEDFDDFINSLEKDWYQKVPDDMKDKIKREEAIKPPKKLKTFKEIFSQLTLDNLYNLFFGSKKRGEERRDRLIFYS